MPVTIQGPLPITFTTASLGSSPCYATEQERFDAFATSLIGTLPNNASMVIAGNGTPTGANEASGGPWIRYDTAQNIDRVYSFQNGRWRSRHPLDPGMIMMWMGAQSAIATLSGGTAGTATADSGPFWEEVTEAIGRVPVHPDPSRTLLQFQAPTPSGGGAPLNNVAVGSRGGEERHQLTTAELAIHNHVLPQSEYAVNAGTATNAFRSTAFNSIHTTNNAGGDQPHNNMQPYIGVYLIRRTIREFYVI